MEATAFKESLEKRFEMIEERPDYEDEQIEDEDDNDE
jgi:hypothetical protein